jgi:hypothetical protein
LKFRLCWTEVIGSRLATRALGVVHTKVAATRANRQNVIIQFARGDKTNPNPTTTALIRAGDLADRSTFFRNDLAFALGLGFKNPTHS